MTGNSLGLRWIARVFSVFGLEHITNEAAHQKKDNADDKKYDNMDGKSIRCPETRRMVREHDNGVDDCRPDEAVDHENLQESVFEDGLSKVKVKEKEET